MKWVLMTPLMEIQPGFWNRAGALRASVLRKRRKARLGDSLIAQSCLDAGIPLLTRDRDFRHFDGIRVDPRDLRVQLEREAMGTLLRLRHYGPEVAAEGGAKVGPDGMRQLVRDDVRRQVGGDAPNQSQRATAAGRTARSPAGG